MVDTLTSWLGWIVARCTVPSPSVEGEIVTAEPRSSVATVIRVVEMKEEASTSLSVVWPGCSSRTVTVATARRWTEPVPSAAPEARIRDWRYASVSQLTLSIEEENVQKRQPAGKAPVGAEKLALWMVLFVLEAKFREELLQKGW
jgi:hypothetical protein